MTEDDTNAAEVTESYFHKNRARFAHYAARQRDKLKLEMVAAYGGKCVDCGIADPIVLSLDHINNDAQVEKEEFGLNARGGHKHYGRLKKAGWPKERFQLMCYNCNAKKEHKRRRDEMNEFWGDDTPADRTAVQARMHIQRHNTSGFKGVIWNAQKGKWQARIMLEYKQYYLGYYENIADAARAYKKAAIAAWGNDANVPSEEEIDRIAAEVMLPQVQTTVASAEDLDL